jgi:hypothetical protein
MLGVRLMLPELGNAAVGSSAGPPELMAKSSGLGEARRSSGVRALYTDESDGISSAMLMVRRLAGG